MRGAAPEVQACDLPTDHWRPTKRGECPPERPCPYVGCRHHLLIDAIHGNGELKLNNACDPGADPVDALLSLPESCALDVAERGGSPHANLDAHVSLEVCADLLGVTRERVRQIEEKGLARAKKELLRRKLTPAKLLDLDWFGEETEASLPSAPLRTMEGPMNATTETTQTKPAGICQAPGCDNEVKPGHKVCSKTCGGLLAKQQNLVTVACTGCGRELTVMAMRRNRTNFCDDCRAKKPAPQPECPPLPTEVATGPTPDPVPPLDLMPLLRTEQAKQTPDAGEPAEIKRLRAQYERTEAERLHLQAELEKTQLTLGERTQQREAAISQRQAAEIRLSEVKAGNERLLTENTQLMKELAELREDRDKALASVRFGLSFESAARHEPQPPAALPAPDQLPFGYAVEVWRMVARTIAAVED